MSGLTKRTDAVVIGGGLAGLATAAYLGRAGKSVTLLERASEAGGRAMTETKNEFNLNLGAHALYCRGQASGVLAELGVAFTGGRPSPSGGYALDGGIRHTLPGGFLSLLTTGLLSLPAKLEIARLLASLGRIDTAALDHLTINEWLERAMGQSDARRFIAAALRVATYVNAPDLQSAGAALAQLRLGQSGVWYLDGGWTTLIAGLRRAAEAAGAEIITGARVESVIRGGGDGRVRGVRLGTGSVIEAPVVVIAAGGPREAASLVEGGETGALGAWAKAAVAARVACFDLGLRRLPDPHAIFALGVDRPLYFSVHSAVARLGPEGTAMIHTAKYLLPGEKFDAQAARSEIEAMLDQVQKGWRSEVIVERYLPQMTVTHSIVRAAAGGLKGRPGPAVPDVPGLYVAGDWVGGEGMLADATLASARSAARAALAAKSRAAAA